MSDSSLSEDVQVRFRELANGYQTKLPRKLALLLPFKLHIKELLERQASYDDIRLLLADGRAAIERVAAGECELRGQEQLSPELSGGLCRWPIETQGGERKGN